MVIAAHLLATPVARWYTRREFAQLKGYEATVYDVRASLLPPRYHLQGLSISEKPAQPRPEPMVFVRNVEVRVEWRKLLHGDLVGNVLLDAPKLDLRQHAHARQEQREPEQLPDLGKSLQQMAPLRIDVLRVRDGAVDFVDATKSPPPQLWLHGVDGEVRDLATREALSRGRPTTLEATGILQHSGRLSARVEADPWAKGLTFSGRVQLRDLAARDIDALIVSSSDLKPTQGSLDLFADFEARSGELNGGVKVMAKDLELAPGRKDSVEPDQVLGRGRRRRHPGKEGAGPAGAAVQGGGDHRAHQGPGRRPERAGVADGPRGGPQRVRRRAEQGLRERAARDQRREAEPVGPGRGRAQEEGRTAQAQPQARTPRR
ncbi:MAG: DUF748 domain-containing protein [Myxococcales bacterium]